MSGNRDQTKNPLDYYVILQVHPKAEKSVIDAAYRKLAARYHPDVSCTPDAAERMKQINAAYEVLSDPVKRAEYDSVRGREPSSRAATKGTRKQPPLSRVWRRLFIPTGIAVLALMAFRLGPRLALLLIVLSVLAWFLFTLARSRK